MILYRVESKPVLTSTDLLKYAQMWQNNEHKCIQTIKHAFDLDIL